MENSSVNKAHYQYRRAENHLRYRRFDEAIECHQKAAELLDDALNFTSVPKAIESLKLQRDFHNKQQSVIKTKKEQYDNFKKAVENQRRRMANSLANNEYDDKQNGESTTLEIAIYKTMEETDSLLQRLVRKEPGSDDSLRSDISSTDTDDRVLAIDTVDGESSSSNITPIGTKRPKDELTVIEELKTLNQQLHSLVYRLVIQLDESNRERDSLRAKVKYLESERLKHTELLTQQETTENVRNNHLRVITDSSGGTSPYVFSPCSELSPDVAENRILPSLAPLELPTFDFSSFTTSTNSEK